MDSPTERVTDLWFEDGTIILQAGSTSFRVYKGLIAARAPALGDALENSEETIDGCPLVRLPDSPEDLTHFLRCIHDFK
jgi:hypothetical protein